MGKVIAMIPARSGSKRIPQKNIKDFCSKPIITYPIETAKASGIFDDIIVYTDDINICEIANNYNIFAQSRLSNDYQTLTETILEFLEWPQYKDIDYLCILLPTAVFIDEIDINHAYQLRCPQNDVIITFCKYSHPIQRAFQLIDGKFQMIHKEYKFMRTQDLTESYCDAGQMYFLNVESFLEQKRIFMDSIYPLVIDAVDIDNPEDWEKAEAYYKYKRGLI